MQSNRRFTRNLYRWCGTAAILAGTMLASSAFAATTTVVAQHSQKCLDVRGGVAATADGARIEQWSCSGLSNQAWTLQDMGNSQYEFIASNSSKCMEVINGGIANGSGIQQATCTGAAKQLWKLTSQGSGKYQIINPASNRCLDVTGGTGATGDGVLTELWDCTGQANQSWALTPPAAAATPLPLVAKHSGKCLDVRGGPTATADGVLIEQWSCSGQSNQNWTLKDMGSGQVELIAQSSGKCAEVINGATANGSGIQQATCTGSPRQLWSKQSAGATGEYKFVNVPANRCLDITGGTGATGDGVLAELWDCTGQANQTWTIGAPAGGGSGGGDTSSGPYGQDASQYVLTFSDEFEGTGIDTSKWVDHLWYLGADSTPNYVVSNGSLKIFPVAGTSYTRDYRHITTDGKYYQTYGYFEIEAKLPYGKGPWPAFWLYNHDNGNLRPEIDIMEAYPGGGASSGWSDSSLNPTAYGATVWIGDGSQAGFKMIQTTNLHAGYHKYAVKWEPNKQTFYFDGNPVYTLNVSMSNRMYILLSFQFGSASGSGDSSTPTGQGNSFDIKYVRAWRFK